MQQGSKCYGIMKQIEPFYIEPSIHNYILARVKCKPVNTQCIMQFLTVFIKQKNITVTAIFISDLNTDNKNTTSNRCRKQSFISGAKKVCSKMNMCTKLKILQQLHFFNVLRRKKHHYVIFFVLSFLQNFILQQIKIRNVNIIYRKLLR